MITLQLQLKNNYQGVRYRISLMFELTALGAILPSYDVETRILDESLFGTMPLYASLGFAMVIFFCLLELVEIRAGLVDYFLDLWNVADWLNFSLYFLVCKDLWHAIDAARNPDCSSYLCSEVGYFDDWDAMVSFRDTKTSLALCMCIQLLKILKFAAALVPKVGLATNVLRKCVVDMIFFGFTFVVSMLAFSTMLFIQLGTVMEDYWDQFNSLISLFRALFGDIDIDEIMSNSSGYLNVLLFLIYLFVAIFIMLSMFLAILVRTTPRLPLSALAAARPPHARPHASPWLDGRTCA